VKRVRGVVPLGLSLVQTAIEACQAEHVLQPCNVARSVAVDTASVSAIDFDLTDEQRAELVQAGEAAALKFLTTWDYDDWVRRCRPGTPPLPT
jgi:NTE family protein